MSMMLAKSLLEAAKSEGVTLRLVGDGVTIAGPAAVKDKYVPAVKAAKPWVRAALRPDDPRPDHQCCVCGGVARFGFEVNTKEGHEGRWTCRDHQGLG